MFRIVAVCLTLCLVVGCPGGPARELPPAPEPAAYLAKELQAKIDDIRSMVDESGISAVKDSAGAFGEWANEFRVPDGIDSNSPAMKAFESFKMLYGEFATISASELEERLAELEAQLKTVAGS